MKVALKLVSTLLDKNIGAATPHLSIRGISHQNEETLDFWLCLKCMVLHPLNIFYRDVATGEIKALIYLKMTV